MGIDWYDMIARRNGGYRGRAVCTVVGRSAEEVFEERLVEMLPQFHSVLDAGCGHGEFTLRMSRHAENIIGFDNSAEMIRISQSLLESSGSGMWNLCMPQRKPRCPFKMVSLISSMTAEDPPRSLNIPGYWLQAAPSSAYIMM
ncbi:class I SAM-dependent methyltransferase [Paenibacillus sp. 843]|uniref:class I SAM-dependent methyltransferase n=1 Tax=Paenibacillus sp. 843 TaxID=3341795 RepID=UPI003729F47E